ncbi:MAG: transcription factor S [Candidatus Nanoarchaeia archaeon]
MFFCPKCSAILVPEQGARKTKLVCSCGYVSKEKEAVIKEEVKTKEIEIKQRKITLPKTKAKCPKCGNKEAYYWLQQTRAADEGETRFFECANSKCTYRWREY